MFMNFDTRPLTGEQIFSLIYTDNGPGGGWSRSGTTMEKCLLMGLSPILINKGRISRFLKQVSLPEAHECEMVDSIGKKRFYILQVSNEAYDQQIAPQKDVITKNTILKVFTESLTISDVDL